ncbi:MAG: hypothetical protein IPK80_27600 [Nannocystis sp.]|nr:hypothetical protein [Nannocystis sp.]
MLDQLDRAARRGGLVLLAGPPGAGRTRTLALWLERTLARRGDDTGLLFAWSFDLVGQPADPRAFLGALADRVDLPRLACLEGSDHALARALARALRHERFVLVLDGVVAQPGVAAGACVERVLHPGLAALLRGLEGATNGACVFTIRAPLELSDLALQVCDLHPLTPVEGSACLWRHGLLIPEPDLLRLSEGLRGNRLALSWVARAPRDALTRSPAPNAADPLIEAIDLLKLGDDARHVLTALVLAGGILTGAQLARSWSFLGSGELLEALAALTDVGLIRVERRLLGAPPEPHLRVELTHPRLRDLVLRRCAQDTGPIQRLSIDDLLGPEPEPLVDAPRGLPALHQRLLALIARGQIADALRLYVTRIACYTHNFEDDAAPEPDPAQRTGIPKQKQWSFIARDLGLYAADLDLLAPFFSRPFSAVHPDLESGTCSRASAVLAFDLAYIHHRAALALRNLGRVRDADLPFAAAYLRYLDLHDLERAATCANDRAELLVMLGDLGRAREAADLAVGHAASHLEAQERGAAHVGRAAQRLRQARVTRSLTHATLGHILHLSGDLSGAAEAFARAEAETLAIAKADSKSASPGEIPSSAQYLFSRPGLYHWIFLLGLLEDSARAGAPLRADALNALEARLSAASTWNARPGINKVSVSYSEYARARLCAVRLIVA